MLSLFFTLILHSYAATTPPHPKCNAYLAVLATGSYLKVSKVGNHYEVTATRPHKKQSMTDLEVEFKLTPTTNGTETGFLVEATKYKVVFGVRSPNPTPLVDLGFVPDNKITGRFSAVANASADGGRSAGYGNTSIDHFKNGAIVLGVSESGEGKISSHYVPSAADPSQYDKLTVTLDEKRLPTAVKIERGTGLEKLAGSKAEKEHHTLMQPYQGQVDSAQAARVLNQLVRQSANIIITDTEVEAIALSLAKKDPRGLSQNGNLLDSADLAATVSSPQGIKLVVDTLNSGKCSIAKDRFRKLLLASDFTTLGSEVKEPELLLLAHTLHQIRNTPLKSKIIVEIITTF